MEDTGITLGRGATLKSDYFRIEIILGAQDGTYNLLLKSDYFRIEMKQTINTLNTGNSSNQTILGLKCTKPTKEIVSIVQLKSDYFRIEMQRISALISVI